MIQLINNTHLIIFKGEECSCVFSLSEIRKTRIIRKDQNTILHSSMLLP